MKNFFISKSRRLRSTPFTSRIEKQGLKSYTVYKRYWCYKCGKYIDEDYSAVEERAINNTTATLYQRYIHRPFSQETRLYCLPCFNLKNNY